MGIAPSGEPAWLARVESTSGSMTPGGGGRGGSLRRDRLPAEQRGAVAGGVDILGGKVVWELDATFGIRWSHASDPSRDGGRRERHSAGGYQARDRGGEVTGLILRISRGKVAAGKEAQFLEATRELLADFTEVDGLLFRYSARRTLDDGRMEYVWLSAWQSAEALIAVVGPPLQPLYLARYPGLVEDSTVELYEVDEFVLPWPADGRGDALAAGGWTAAPPCSGCRADPTIRAGAHRGLRSAWQGRDRPSGRRGMAAAWSCAHTPSHRRMAVDWR